MEEFLVFHLFSYPYPGKFKRYFFIVAQTYLLSINK